MTDGTPIRANGERVGHQDVSDAPNIELVGLTLGSYPVYNMFHYAPIDEFAIYKRVLSPDEIRAHYLNGAP